MERIFKNTFLGLVVAVILCLPPVASLSSIAAASFELTEKKAVILALVSCGVVLYIDNYNPKTCFFNYSCPDPLDTLLSCRPPFFNSTSSKIERKCGSTDIKAPSNVPSLETICVGDKGLGELITNEECTNYFTPLLALPVLVTFIWSLHRLGVTIFDRCAFHH